MSGPARLERAVPLFRVQDAAAACAYYCERLGFAKEWDLDGNRLRFGGRADAGSGKPER